MSQSLNDIISELPSHYEIHSYLDYYDRIQELFAIKSDNTKQQALDMVNAMNKEDKLFLFNDCDISEELSIFLIQQTEGTEL